MSFGSYITPRPDWPVHEWAKTYWVVKRLKNGEADDPSAWEEVVVDSYGAAEALLREINPLTQKPYVGVVRHAPKPS
ncbi:hypothetical protein [Streptomyces sp. NPDC020489]|uniref:hypothetical protein n=1 Tax=Streptomyces sp. NPDC020489 TaxID=3365077 RepID=UPI0037BB0AB9